jgi:hypothetical protein
LLGDPFVDPLSRKRTVGDDAMAVAILFGNRSKRGDGNREGKELPVKGAKKAAMGKFLLDVGTDIFDAIIGRRMVSGSAGGMRGPDDADVPAVHHTFNDGKKIPIVVKVFCPDDRLEVGGNGHSDAILICPTRLHNLKDEFNSLVDKVGAGTKRPLTTRTGRRTSRTKVITRRSNRIKDERVDDDAVDERNEPIG